MEKFNSYPQILQLMVNWKITTDERNNFENYARIFALDKEKIIHINSDILSLKNMSETFKEITNFIFFFNFVDENTSFFKVNIPTKDAKLFKQNGFILDDEDNLLYKYNTDKQIISNIYRVGNSKRYQINFSFLDKRYSRINRDFQNANIASLIDAIDKQKFEKHWFNFHTQTDMHDNLFANASIVLSEEELCEFGAFWLLDTTWMMYFEKIQNEIKKYCLEHDINYHYSYRASIKNMSGVLKHINAQIIEDFFKLHDLFLKYQRVLLTNNVCSKNENQITRESFVNLTNKILNLIEKKIKVLREFIYLTNLIS